MKIIVPNLANSKMRFSKERDFIEVDEKAIMAMSFLLAYSDNDNLVDYLRVDADGNLLVSSGGTSATSLENSVATITNTVGTLVSSRSDRKSMSIRNNGSEAIYVGKNTSVTTSNGLIIDSGSVYHIENFTGTLYAISATGSVDVRIGEWV